MEAEKGSRHCASGGISVGGQSRSHISDWVLTGGEFCHGIQGKVCENHTPCRLLTSVCLAPCLLAAWGDPGRSWEPGDDLLQATVLIQPRRKISNGRLISPCHFPRGLKQSREQFSLPGTPPSGSWRGWAAVWRQVKDSPQPSSPSFGAGWLAREKCAR